MRARLRRLWRRRQARALPAQRAQVGLGLLGALLALSALLWLGRQAAPLQAQSGYSCSPDYHIDVTLPTGARWDLCWEPRSLEGVVLHDIHYAPPGGTRRLVLASAGLAQIHVPYDDDGARFHDVSDFGLGGRFLLDLSAEECPDGQRLSHGNKRVLCLQTPRRGFAYKYYGRQQQGYALNLFSISASGDYNYINAWRFTDDGVIEPSIGAAGKLQRYGADERYGWRTAPDRVPVSHTHNYYWRLDFDIDGQADDLVEEIEFLPEDDGRKFAISVEPIVEEAGRSLSPTTMRSWRVRDKTIVNADGHSISYHLDPIRNGHDFVGPDFEPWTHHDLYVTAMRGCERFTSHNPFVNRCGRDVTEFVNGESVDGADLVVWYGVTFHHLPRDEEEPDMPVHWDGFQILPRDWMAASPALTDGGVVTPPAATPTASVMSTATATRLPATPVPGAPLTASPQQIELRNQVGQAARTVTLASAGEASSIAWQAAASVDWLQLSASEGQTPAALTIELAPKGLSAGAHSATVTLTSPQAPDRPVGIRVDARIDDGYRQFLPLVGR